MFFNLAWRNSKRSRNENLIYFLTMVTAVAAFYIVLSLGAQDVIRFLSSLESDAVERLLTNLLPTVYVCALLFVFFLVVFANKYQLECRSRELGLYLMFGMTKTRLFTQIMTEGAYHFTCRPLGWTYLRWFSIRSYQPCNGTFSRTRCYCTSIKFFIKRSFLYDIGIFNHPMCGVVYTMRKIV